jgi:type I restriction enzyme S subunit
MREGWEIKTIGELCDLATGGTPSRAKPEYFGGEIKWLVSGDINQGEIFDCEGRITESGMKNSNAKLLPINSVMIALNGQGKTRGTVSLLRTLATCNQSMVCISPKPTSGLLPEFLYANLHGRYEEIRRMTSDDDKDRRGLNMGLVRGIKIPIAPLPEQQRIVVLLDEAFAGLATAKANAEQNLQNARAIFESHLQSVFSQRGEEWVEKALEGCCEQIFAGGDVPKDRLSKVRTSQYSVPIYSNGEKDDGLYGFTDIARVTKPSVTVSARGTLGFSAIRTESFLPVVRLIVLVPDTEQISLPFLYYAVVGMNFGNTGTSIPQLTVPNIKESKLHHPPLSGQIDIVKKLDALTEETQRLTRLYERKLAALEELKKSLLHQAFNGEL